MQSPRWREAGLVLLAAGSSQRMGRSKQLLEIDGVPMLRRATIAALESGARHVVVVCSSGSAPEADAVSDLPVVLCANPLHRDGIGTSIACGTRALVRFGVDAAIIALGDQPLVDAGTYDALAEEWRTHDVDIVASSYGGSVGVPALFDRVLFERLAALAADQGCKRMIEGHASSRVRIRPCPQAATDIDTPEDFARFREARTG